MTIEQIKKKISYYESKLYQAKCEEHRKMNSIPWGAGFSPRGGYKKFTISTAKSDHYQKMLDKWNIKLQEALEKQELPLFNISNKQDLGD